MARESFGQIDTATMAGTVIDSSGAAVSSATVSARNEATGLVEQQKVTGKGNYSFTALKVGNYTLTAMAPGFDKVPAGSCRA